MTPQEFEDRILTWARRQPDIEALIQFGSRVQSEGICDVLSDWDFHVYSQRPSRYRRTDWLAEIGVPWCAHAERSSRGVVKVSAIFEDCIEADFIPLAAWQMKLVYWGMKHRELLQIMPSRLRNGISETREILLNSSFRVLIGGEAWEHRLRALRMEWPEMRMSEEELLRHVAGFWQKSVWLTKKIARPEPRSAQLWLHKLSGEHVYALLEEEAWLSGIKARPQALKAEKWLNARRLEQTNFTTSLDAKVLARALCSQLDLFEEVSRSVAQSRGFRLPDHSAVAAWLRAELDRIILRE